MTGIRSVHHLHIWAIDSEATALTAHLELEDGTDLHQAQELADAARVMLHERFNIAHATFEPECHDCGAPEHDHGSISAAQSADLHLNALSDLPTEALPRTVE
jgi:cobalt-zinc-cadmium efflux system protein